MLNSSWLFKKTEKTISIHADGNMYPVGDMEPEIPQGYKIVIASVKSSWAWALPAFSNCTNETPWRVYCVTSNNNQDIDVTFSASFILLRES